LRPTFLKSRDASLAAIRAASDAGDPAQVLAELHSLRGTFGVFGYAALADQCAELEARIRQHGLTAIGERDLDLHIQNVEPVGT
jgi:two-component system capsular synthesis sensor histidine kinase RcsC